jgi:precorrin-6B methylase 2
MVLKQIALSYTSIRKDVLSHNVRIVVDFARLERNMSSVTALKKLIPKKIVLMTRAKSRKVMPPQIWYESALIGV